MLYLFVILNFSVANYSGHAEVLCRAYKNVSEKLNAESIACSMFVRNALTLEELESIECKWREPIKAAERLLDIVMNKSRSVYQDFLNALKDTGQEQIYESLITSWKGKKFVYSRVSCGNCSICLRVRQQN